VSLDADGNLYGTTSTNGPAGGGTVFEISGGTFTTLHNFSSVPAARDGWYPNAPVLVGTNGTLYGTTQFGGAFGYEHNGQGDGTEYALP
jgi:uncharacterized repeat protein (TIGR03803 family)